MINWKDSYDIGVEKIDCQHRQLLVKLNEFFDACTNQQGKEKIEETLKFLKDYTLEHFSDEEKLMQDIEFPELTEHRKTHAEFVQTVLDLEESIKTKGISVLSTIKLNRTLTDWLLNHINKCDKLIGQCMASKGNQAI
ncbi:hemerythrin [Paenibacillus helianthi]|uniref:Hemerythrin n=1 Tax=Paenibacillus helianthi TaxID=1349432 RepID=A0ABX3EXS1_9BACL|nr:MULTISPECIES: bacteriohemerythrin [Paenibacillus]OKP66529.1 hemerythrin [Paenibacillus sp. P3E]OKP91660.1 hemerythrin [Paenibacillus helianthi]OKP94010.1 hemerythrin [Paenibacillus sp. P32E]